MLLPTITSPVFSDVVIVIESGSINAVCPPQPGLFKFVQDMYEVKPFRLVLCLEVWEGDLEDTTKWLRGYIDTDRGGQRRIVFSFPPTDYRLQHAGDTLFEVGRTVSVGMIVFIGGVTYCRPG